MAGSKVFRTDGDDHRTVGIAPRTVRIAHSVHRRLPFLRCGIDHISARTHAERINSSAVPAPVGQFIRRSAQDFRWIFAILVFIDHFLRMFNPYTHCKRLRLHQDPCPFQLEKGVSGTVSHGKHRHGSLQILPVIDGHTHQPAVFDIKIGHTGAEPDGAAPCFDLMAHVLNDGDQLVSPEMGLLVIQDLRRSSRFTENPQYFLIAPMRIFHRGIQLSVGKGPGSALAELHIGLCVQNSRVPELFHFLLADVRLVSPLQQDRAVAALCQIIGTEQTRRTAAYDHRSLCKFLASRFRKTIALCVG